MSTSDTAVISPTSGAEAAAVLAEHPRWLPLAGGTDVMVLLHSGALSPPGLVDLSRCDDLHSLDEVNGALRIGALTTHAELAASDLVRHRCPILAEAAGQVGSRQIQHRGTIGGNIGNASPAGDTLPVLVACDASVELLGPDGATRTVSMDQLYTGYRQMCTRPGELIAAVVIPAPEPDALFGFYKVGSRRAFYCSKVVLAGVGTVRGGEIAGLSLAAGSVGETVVRLARAQAAGEGRRSDDPDVPEAVAASAMAEIAPITDVRSTEDYRQAVVGRLVARYVRDLAAGTLPGVTG